MTVYSYSTDTTILINFTGRAFSGIERIAFDYNEDSRIDIDEIPYGRIVDTVTEAEDYGSINDSIDYYYQIEDFGLITINTTEIPFGRMRIRPKVDESIAVVASVGGVLFAVFGRSNYEVIFNPINRVFDFEGKALQRVTFAYEGKGTFSTVSGTADSVGYNPPESVFLFKISGKAITAPIFNPGDRILDIEGKAQDSITYSYNESSIVTLESDDYGFISDSPLRSDDYGLIVDNLPLEQWQPYNIDYGFLEPNNTSLPYGRTKFVSTTEESNSFVYVAEPKNCITISGTAIDKATPKQIGDGTIVVSGTPRVRFRLRYIGSGSAFGFNSASESILVNPPIDQEQTRIFEFVGESSESFAKGNYDASGSLFALNSSTISSLFNQTKSEVLFKITGTPRVRFRLRYIGSGSIFSFVSATESRSVSEVSTELFKFSGTAVEKNAESYVGSGSIFSFASSTETRRVSEVSTELFKFSGTVVERNTESYVGSGSLFGLSGSAERVSYSYNESSIVTLDSEDYGYIADNHNLESDYGLITENPVYPFESYFPWQTIDYGYLTPNNTILPYGKIDISDKGKTNFALVHVGTGSISVTGVAKVYVTPQEFGVGFIKVGGFADSKLAVKNIGSGSIFSFVSSTETRRVSEVSTELFRFFGSAIERNTEAYTGVGTLFNFDSVDPIFRLKHIGSGSIKISGFAKESTAPAPHVGSGSIFSFVSATESRSVSEVSTELFKFSGTAVERNSEVYNGDALIDVNGTPIVKITSVYDGSGFINIEGSALESNVESYVGLGTIFLSNVIDKNLDPSYRYFTEIETVSWNPPESGSLFGISGFSAERISEGNYNGSGTLFAFDSKAESRSNAESFKQLFKFAGSANESYVRSTYVGSGSLFSFVSFAESISFNPPETTELFKFSGTSVERNTEAYNGSGNLFAIVGTEDSRRSSEQFSGIIKINGSGQESITPTTHIGSGSIFSFVSFEESVSVKETFRDLFKFSGTAIERNTESYLGSGEININGAVSTIFKLRYFGSGSIDINGSGQESIAPTTYIGSGSIFSFVSATESRTTVETSRELFRFSGTAGERNTESYLGSGSIFSFVSATETTSVSQLSTGLFKFSGTAVEKNTETYLGSGSIFSFVSATESRTTVETSRELFKFSGAAGESYVRAPYVGSGSIFTFVSSTETRRVSEVSTELFKFSGTAVEKNTESYLGSGSIFTFVSATESRSNVEISKELFKFSGTSKESFVPTTYVGSGAIFTFVSSTESRSTSEVSEGIFKFSGSAVERNTESYLGSGSVFSFVSSTETRRVSEVSTELFKFSGSVKESFVPTTYVGSGSIFTFISATESRTGVEKGTAELFRFSGNSSERKANTQLGFGSIFAFVSSTKSKTNTISEPVSLFKLSGSAKESYSRVGYDGSGSIFTFVSSTETKTSTETTPPVLSKFTGTADPVVRLRAFDGSGSVFTFVSTATTRSNTVSEPGDLFKLSGSGNEAFARALYIAKVSATLSGLSFNQKVNFVPAAPTRIIII